MKKIAVVIPTYNEVENLDELVHEIWHQLPGAHIIVVDDNSPDGTYRLALRLSHLYPEHLTPFLREKKAGLRAAYEFGFNRALEMGFDLIAQMDADFSHPPEYLPKLVEMCKEADVVVASRYRIDTPVHMNAIRRALSRSGSLYANFWLGTKLSDLTSGFKCWKREALEEVLSSPLTATGFYFQVEMSYRALRRGMRVLELDVPFHKRRYGTSKMSLGIAFEAIVKIPLMKLKNNISKKGRVVHEIGPREEAVLREVA